MRLDMRLQEFGQEIAKPIKKKHRQVNNKKLKNHAKHAAISKFRADILKNNKWLIVERKQSDPSPPEKIIGDFLAAQNILFYREHAIKGLYNPITDKPLFFDFFIPEYNLAIEFDGKHHFRQGNMTDYVFEGIKFRDRIKNSFCRKRKINLLRIPYWEGHRIEYIICEKCDQIKPND